MLRYKTFELKIIVTPKPDIEEVDETSDKEKEPSPSFEKKLTLISVDDRGTVILDTENLNSQAELEELLKTVKLDNNGDPINFDRIFISSFKYGRAIITIKGL